MKMHINGYVHFKNEDMKATQDFISGYHILRIFQAMKKKHVNTWKQLIQIDPEKARS